VSKHEGITERQSRGRSVFLARVWDPKAKKHTNRTFATLADAQRWRRANLVQIDQGVQIVGPSETLRQHAEAWITGLASGQTLTRMGTRYGIETSAKYTSALERFVLPALGAYRLGEIDRRMVQQLVDRLRAEGRSGTDQRNAIKPLQAIYRELCRDGLVALNPTLNLRLDRTVSRKERILDPEHPARVVSAAEAAGMLAALTGQVRVVFALAFYAGLRDAEMRGLRWSDVDLERGVIRLAGGMDQKRNRVALKGRRPGESRDVPIVELLRRELVLWQLESRRTQGLVAGSTGRDPFTIRWMQKQADRAWSAAGIARVTPHLARHTFGSILASAGVPDDEIRRAMGHLSEDVRALYTHQLPDELARMRARLDAYFADHGPIRG
jgi:integrase